MPRKISGGDVSPIVLFAALEEPIPLAVDSNQNALVVIDSIHELAHNSRMFNSSYKTPDASPIADDGILDILIQTDTKTPYVAFYVSAGGDMNIEFYEDVITSDDGTAMLEANINRVDPVLSTTIVTHTPTVTDTGTELLSIYQPGGTKSDAIGGALFFWSDWVLKGTTKYLIRVTNRAGAEEPMSVSVRWYEL